LAEMVTGQLYRVGLTCMAPHQRGTVELLIVASSVDDAKAKVPWVFDLSDWTEYRVDYTAKEPGRCYVIKLTHKRAPENEPDVNVKRDQGSQGSGSQGFQQTPPPQGKKWSVVARTTCYAKDGDHAVKKLAQRVSGGSDFVQWAAEEVANASGFATAKDMSMFPRAHFVRG